MNNRDRQIAAIASRVTNLNQEKLATFYRDVRESYEASSIVERLAVVNEIDDREPSDFRILNSQELRRLEHFNDDSYMWDMYCKEMGRSVALGEQAYFFEEAQQRLPNVAVTPGVGFEGIYSAIRALLAAGYRPDVVLAPISYMVRFLSTEDRRLRWDANGHEWLTIDERHINIIWSSAGRSLDRFIVFDHHAGTWNVKLDPTSNTRLTVAIGEQVEPVHGVLWLAETTVKYEINDMRAFMSIRPDLPLDASFDAPR